MRPRLLAVLAMFLCLRGVASAHRLDEYLQATLISVEKDHMQASMRMIPGVAVASSVIASIDSNGDGVFSREEQTAYAERVLSDLSLTADGASVRPKLISVDFPSITQMREGLGEIHIEFRAEFERGSRNRRLILESHRNDPKTVYLVNCLLPRDHNIEIVAQKRNEQQSFYEVDYVQADAPAYVASSDWPGGIRRLMVESSFVSLFRLGIRHIAEGTDHLLFLLALLLPAPLTAVGCHWSGVTNIRGSVLRILKIVTAFTVGHSITLALAASGLVSAPSRPVEVLIAVSILVSALHALRPIFPGKEAAIAAFFGLIHGVAFAATLSQLGLGRWERVCGVLAFNLGIEVMQLAAVAATMPSLILLSRTRVYPVLRMSGAAFCCIAAVGWITERLLGVPNPVSGVVELVAHHAMWAAILSCVISVGCWAMPGFGHTGSREEEACV